jgi:hypothetical protein
MLGISWVAAQLTASQEGLSSMSEWVRGDLRIRLILDWMIGFIAPYTLTPRDYRQYSAIAILHTFQFTVSHKLGSSVFTSRILQRIFQSHRHFNSHMKSSWHSLIPFFSFLLSHLRQPSQKFDAILHYFFLLLLFSTPSQLLTVPFYNPSARTIQKTQSSIVKDACLLVRYLAMDVLLSRARVLRECVYRVVA